MKISNKVKKNISLALIIAGVIICVGCSLNIIMDYSSFNDFMQLCSAIGFTLIAYAYFSVYRERIKNGILFGNTSLKTNK